MFKWIKSGKSSQGCPECKKYRSTVAWLSNKCWEESWEPDALKKENIQLEKEVVFWKEKAMNFKRFYQ